MAVKDLRKKTEGLELVLYSISRNSLASGLKA